MDAGLWLSNAGVLQCLNDLIICDVLTYAPSDTVILRPVHVKSPFGCLETSEVAISNEHKVRQTFCMRTYFLATKSTLIHFPIISCNVCCWVTPPPVHNLSGGKANGKNIPRLFPQFSQDFTWFVAAWWKISTFASDNPCGQICWKLELDSLVLDDL